MCTHAYLYTAHTYVHIYAHTCIHTPIYIHAIYAHMHACTYCRHTEKYIHAYTQIQKYTCLYTNTNIHTCIYTHAYIHGKLILALKKGKMDKFWDDSFIPNAFLTD